MSLRSRLDKLEPRERRLLTILGSVFAVLIFLLIPFGIYSMLQSRRTANDDVRQVVDALYEGRAAVAEKRAKKDAILARYARPAPPLAGFLDQAAQAQGLSAAESQDRPELPHGKRYSERMTVIKMHKVGMLPLAKMLEKIEQSGYPIAITRLNLKPRAGEPDAYEVELGVSAFDRKSDSPSGATVAPTSSPATSAAPDKEP